MHPHIGLSQSTEKQPMRKRAITVCTMVLGVALVGAGTFYLLRHGRRIGESDNAWAMAKLVHVRLVQYTEKNDGNFPDSLTDPDVMGTDAEFAEYAVNKLKVEYRRPDEGTPDDQIVFEIRIGDGTLVLRKALQQVEWISDEE